MCINHQVLASSPPSRLVYTFHDAPPPTPALHEHPALRCDVCDTLIAGAPAGEGVYLWLRGGTPHFEPAPLCPSCATAIGIASLRQIEEEEEGG